MSRKNEGKIRNKKIMNGRTIIPKKSMKKQSKLKNWELKEGT